MSERETALEELLKGAHTVELNMNDTFGYACAESVTFDVSDLNRMVPILARYGQDALTAYAAVKTNRTPIDCRCNHKNDRYRAAKVEIEAARLDDWYFCRDEAEERLEEKHGDMAITFGMIRRGRAALSLSEDDKG
jgi:hypothetical protein